MPLHRGSRPNSARMMSAMLPVSPQFEEALRILLALREAGYEAYLAGGCVRDLVLGREPADYDVATSATPDVVLGMFDRTFAVGAHFGVVLVAPADENARFVTEVATFRSDGIYSDGRHPDVVEYTRNAEDDVRRRDFTINGLLLDPLRATDNPRAAVIDHVGGLADLDAGVVRAIGRPELRFEEDRLRMLRAVRFAARFGFEIDPATLASYPRPRLPHPRRQPRAHPRRTDQNAHRRPRPPRLRAAR